MKLPLNPVRIAADAIKSGALRGPMTIYPLTPEESFEFPNVKFPKEAGIAPVEITPAPLHKPYKKIKPRPERYVITRKEAEKIVGYRI